MNLMVEAGAHQPVQRGAQDGRGAVAEPTRPRVGTAPRGPLARRVLGSRMLVPRIRLLSGLRIPPHLNTKVIRTIMPLAHMHQLLLADITPAHRLQCNPIAPMAIKKAPMLASQHRRLHLHLHRLLHPHTMGPGKMAIIPARPTGDILRQPRHLRQAIAPPNGWVDETAMSRTHRHTRIQVLGVLKCTDHDRLISCLYGVFFFASVLLSLLFCFLLGSLTSRFRILFYGYL
jgi:hypothetical protein